MKTHLITKTFEVGIFSTNCHVSNCEKTREAVIIDPGFDNPVEARTITSYIRDNGLRLKFIIDTHGHPDHTCGNGVIKRIFHVPILIHESDAYMLGESGKSTSGFFGFDDVSPPADMLLHDGDSVKFGKETLRGSSYPRSQCWKHSARWKERDLFRRYTFFGVNRKNRFSRKFRTKHAAFLEEVVVPSG